MDSFVQKEITRKEFLIYLGVLILTVTGISGFIKSVKRIHSTDKVKQSSGFGGSNYGS